MIYSLMLASLPHPFQVIQLHDPADELGEGSFRDPNPAISDKNIEGTWHVPITVASLRNAIIVDDSRTKPDMGMRSIKAVGACMDIIDAGHMSATPTLAVDANDGILYCRVDSAILASVNWDVA
jgi:hypothetical protein